MVTGGDVEEEVDDDEDEENEDSDEERAGPAVDCCNKMVVAMYSGV